MKFLIKTTHDDVVALVHLLDQDLADLRRYREGFEHARLQMPHILLLTFYGNAEFFDVSKDEDEDELVFDVLDGADFTRVEETFCELASQIPTARDQMHIGPEGVYWTADVQDHSETYETEVLPWTEIFPPAEGVTLVLDAAERDDVVHALEEYVADLGKYAEDGPELDARLARYRSVLARLDPKNHAQKDTKAEDQP